MKENHRETHHKAERTNYLCDVCRQPGATDMTAEFLCGPCSVKRTLEWKGPVLVQVSWPKEVQR